MTLLFIQCLQAVAAKTYGFTEGFLGKTWKEMDLVDIDLELW